MSWDAEITWWTHPVGNKNAIIKANHVIQLIIAELSLVQYGRLCVCVCVEATRFQGVVCCKACDSNCQLLPPKVILLVCVTR